jgi:cobalt transporter subunit CbtB
MLEQIETPTIVASLSAQQRLVTGTIAALLGTFMMLGVGFAHVDAIHNSAHDTRHSVSFPCH